jgi:hypothetical protein
VPFAAYRSVNGVLEQMHVRWRDVDGDGEWSQHIDYNEVTPYSGYLRLAQQSTNGNNDSGLTKDELDALEANLADKGATWYETYSGPHYDSIGYEPFVIMGYTSEPYDVTKEAQYATYSDGLLAGACESLNDYWYYFYDNTTSETCNAPVTVPSMTTWAQNQTNAYTPTVSDNGMYYGVYAGPIIYAQYMNTVSDYSGIWGAFDAGPPTQANIAAARDAYIANGYNPPSYEGAAAMVLVNNKINTSNVSFVLDSSELLPEKKVFDLANITAWPNPYYGSMKEETNQYDQRVMFSNLPSEGETTVRIFTVDGTLVRLLKHNDVGSQHLTWDLNNEYGLPVASGMYFAHVATRGEAKVLKLAIVQPEMRIDTY